MKIFNYTKIYEDYKKNLLNNLRSFGKGNDDLLLWVPNENINISINNLLDSLEAYKIQIDFNKKEFESINKTKIHSYFKSEGKIIFSHKDNSLIFHRLSKSNQINIDRVKNKKKNIQKTKIIKNFDSKSLLNKNYLQNLKKVKLSKKNKKEFSSNTTLEEIYYEDRVCKLIIFVNPNSHYVVDGRFFLKKKNQIIEIFGLYFLKLLINLPINEAKDHLLTKIEYLLRPKNIEKNKGIILKSSAGKIFIFFQKIIDNLYLKYVDQTKTKFGINFYNYKVPANWIKLSKKQKILNIEKNLVYFNKKEKLNNLFKLNDILDSNKLFFYFDNKKIGAWRAESLLFKLEKFINDRLKIKFEVYYKVRKDENKLRTI